MKWIPDSTGRFAWRPYYDQEELNYECERLVTNFLNERYGETRFPISTDDLSVMVEQETSDLDVYADLSVEGADVEGVTEFFPRRKPAVKVSRELSLDNSKNHRLRTTLAHEYGHVRFHSFLWNLEPRKQSTQQVLSEIDVQRRKFEQFRKHIASPRCQQDPGAYVRESIPSASRKHETAFLCKQNSIIDAPFSDWMEWQASYVSGAILLPLSRLETVIRSNHTQPIPALSDSADELVVRIAESFEVSTGAARVRLQKLGFLQTMPRGVLVGPASNISVA